MNKVFPFAAKLLLFLWISISIIMVIPEYIQKSNLPKKSYGSPKIITEQLSFDSMPISQIVDDGTYLYAMVDSHQGYVQVYDLRGNYQQTISLYDPSTNGVFEMAIDLGTLYIRDPVQNIYVFHSGRFVQFIRKDEVPQQLQEISYKENSVHYKIQLGSIWKIDEQEQKCIVQRSLKAIIHQYYLNWFFTFFVFLIIGIFCIKAKQQG